LYYRLRHVATSLVFYEKPQKKISDFNTNSHQYLTCNLTQFYAVNFLFFQ